MTTTDTRTVSVEQLQRWHDFMLSVHRGEWSSRLDRDDLTDEIESLIEQDDAPASAIPPQIAVIIEQLHTQDNRITSYPLFAVQQKREISGLDAEYADKFAWVDYDGEVTYSDEVARFNTLRNAGDNLPAGVRRVGYVEKWEFVTGCMTEQGCKDFIACNGHNLKEPRIYAYSGYRNAEFIALREWLMSLRPPILSQQSEQKP